MKGISGFSVNGHFVYRAGGEWAAAWCAETVKGPFRMGKGVVECQKCWNAIIRCYRRAWARGVEIPERWRLYLARRVQESEKGSRNAD